MAKKPQSKSSAAKTRAKAPQQKTTAAAAPIVSKTRTTSAPPSASKYDQSGAPWWKKFRPTEAGATEPKR